MDSAFSVGQLLRKVNNAIALGFRGPVWVQGEIKSFRENRGSWYITLVEPGDHADGGDVSLDVACWPKRKQMLSAQLAQAGVSLVAGLEVRIQGNLGLAKTGRLQLELSALDTEALVGKQATEKRRLYEALAKEDLLERNKRIAVPLVPLRIGLVTSEGSEGFNDFMGQLDRSGFDFKVSLVHSPVQGPTAPNLLARAIATFGSEVDLVAVVRGGGGELDAFDKEPVARAIAASGRPVWTGIGHTGDRSVSDDVANRSYITPTECGQAIVKTVAEYLTHVDELKHRIGRLVSQGVDRQFADVHNLGRLLSRSVSTQLERAQSQVHRSAEKACRSAEHDLAINRVKIQHLAQKLSRSADSTHDRSLKRLESLRMQVTTLDPSRQLQRGYTMTRNKAGKLIKSVTDLNVSEEMITSFADGTVHSTVTSVDAKQNQESK